MALPKKLPLLTAGIDEAGRGPLAGPVVAAAVILNPKKPIKGLNDSKLLSEKKRNILAEIIRENAIAWSIARADVHEIDKINILQASLLAMQRAVAALSIPPEHALVDGNCCPKLSCVTQAIVKGDLLIPAISAASILAKVTRDAEMIEMDNQFPGYGFAEHKGYGTEKHLKAIRQLGITEIHRRSFAPVHERLTFEFNLLQEID